MDPFKRQLSPVQTVLSVYKFPEAIVAMAEEAIHSEGVSPYQQTLKDIDAAIGRLKRARREMQELAAHIHQWGSNDYCVICHADGRA